MAIIGWVGGVPVDDKCRLCGQPQAGHPDLCDESALAAHKAKARRKANRAAKDDLMRSLGLTKVKGAVSGKTYWE